MSRCAVCGRGACIPSFHSFEEQDEADRRRLTADEELYCEPLASEHKGAARPEGDESMMLSMLKTSSWNVRYSLPPDPDNGRRWAKNGQATCLCDTAEEALQLIRQVHNDVTILGVNHQGTGTETYCEQRHIVLMAAPPNGDERPKEG